MKRVPCECYLCDGAFRILRGEFTWSIDPEWSPYIEGDIISMKSRVSADELEDYQGVIVLQTMTADRLAFTMLNARCVALVASIRAIGRPWVRWEGSHMAEVGASFVRPRQQC